jgi:hypothetical protein
MKSNTDGLCPYCKLSFDATEAKIGFPGRIKGKSISLIFALCPKCDDALMHGDIKKQTETIRTSYTNVMSNPQLDWTITTSLALDAYSENFFNAWWYGLEVPELVIDAINDGLVDGIVFLPTLYNFEGFDHA